MTLDGFKVNTYLILGKILGTVIREEDIKILKKENFRPYTRIHGKTWV